MTASFKYSKLPASSAKPSKSGKLLSVDWMKSTDITRRHVMAGASMTMAAGLSACAAVQGGAGTKVAQTDFVLVHGAWHGAWCWRRVTDRLIAAGHRVWVPTLTGLSDRAHLLSPSVTLETHIDDVARLVQWEELTSIVLVGHSYGGMVVSGAAEALGDRVRSLVYLDAFVPQAGQSLVDISGPATGLVLDKMAASSGGLSLPPFTAKAFGVSDSDASWVNGKMTPHPYSTFKGKIATVQARDRIPKKTYVRAQKFPSAAFDEHTKRYTGQPGWTVIALQEGHDVMVIVPELTTKILLDAAA